jgi:hypothetical protein
MIARLKLSRGCAALLLAGCAATPTSTKSPVVDSMKGARVLDQQGVVAFESGRYHDALMFFEASLAHGGPSLERWNAAKCYLKLDEPEKADAELSQYMTGSDLTPDDRRDGEALLYSLRHRPSMVTVVSTPLGVPVSVDGHAVGATPVTALVVPGDHVVALMRGPDVVDSHLVTARYGRAILVEAHP